ncbi:D-amino acid dehydrogenase [Mesorhizobium tianshanense]|uniref:D-amino-acid dehydrogenase n=1 Tax=Mesorhizobium tianshanense TaxID=39844 RepID=A0A562MR00_9HYPH|nr:FAD-dependent oxidoreductase [Mesorhizobium tianshanense]TWI22306.1 D-amino-acid dehydrogenase [Mesorhizobium tianshanense]GLS36956.1 D-amino acid dehydrogenase [Mesorhizobium tianshanense]
MSESARKRSIAVIGAGVAGMMTAYALSKRGVQVLVIDAMSGPAEMCSRANAGIIAVGHAKAWAGPQAIGAMFKVIAGRDPSVKVSRILDPALWRWGIEFLANCTPHAHHRNTDALQRLSRYSRDLIAAAETEMDLPNEVRRNGGLYVFQNESQFNTYVASIKDHGDDSITALERDELIAREPGLSGLSSRLVGGLYSAADCVGDCRLFTQRTAAFLNKSNKARFCFGARVTGFRTSFNTIQAVRTDQGEIPCGAVILATGVETPELTRALGFAPNIYPVKGYSGTWTITDPAKVPALPFVDETELLAVAAYGGQLRVTAIAEFAAHDRSIPEERIAQIGDYVLRSFGDAVELKTPEFWSGLRPTTPAGPPFLGKVRKYSNLWINAGHGQLGWTMALGCGELLTQRIMGEQTPLQNPSSAASWLA